MVYLLLDNPKDKQNMEFLNNYGMLTIQQVYPSQKCNSIKQMLSACMKCIKQSKKDDVIICWYDFMAVLCWWLCKFGCKKRKIIALNILLKNKNTVKNKLAKLLYKPVLRADNVQATVTSKTYGKYLNEMLGINKDYILLHDIYHSDYSIQYEGESIPNTVFCGGRNGRDWCFLSKIAQTLPNVIFNCVMPNDEYEQHKDSFGKNVIVKTEIPEREFLELMCQSQMVVMPLDTEAPAGLICFYQAAANGKMTITSNTVANQEYFVDGRGVLCGKNVEEWKNKIQYYLQHKDEADRFAINLKKFLETECSEKKYAEILNKMLVE